MMYTTEWTALVRVTFEDGEFDVYRSRCGAKTAEAARAAFRNSAKKEYGDDVKVSVTQLRENIYAGGN